MKRIEAVVQRCFVKKLFLEISQNSRENTCPRASFLIKLQASGFLDSINVTIILTARSTAPWNDETGTQGSWSQYVNN